MILEAKEKALQGEGLELVSPKQMLQTLPIMHLKHKVGQIICQWSYKTEWILYLQILKIVKTPDSHRLLLKLSDKIDLKRSDKDVAWSNFHRV